MTTALLPVPIFRAFDSAGDPLAGGLLYTYYANTTSPASTWVDDLRVTANTNPVVLDSTGTATVRLDSTLAYKLVLKDSGGATQWTVDYYRTNNGNQVDVLQYGADNTGVADSSTAFVNAAAASNSVFIPPGTYLLTAGVLAFTTPVFLRGASRGSVTLRCTSGTANLLSWSTVVTGGGISDVTINGTGMTGGILVSNIGQARWTIKDCTVSGGYNGIYIQDQNVAIISNVWMSGQTGEYAIKGYGSGTGAYNVLDINNVQVGFSTNGATSPTGLILDGDAATTDIRHFGVVKGFRGISIVNTPGFALGPSFVTAYDVQSDFAYDAGLHMDGGTGWTQTHQFSQCYFQGCQNGDGVYIESTCRYVVLDGAQITGNWNRGVFAGGRYVKIFGCQISSNSQSASGTFSGVDIGAASLNVQLIGNHIGQWVGVSAASQAYGVDIIAGAANYVVVGNSLTFNVTAAYRDSANSTTATIFGNAQTAATPHIISSPIQAQVGQSLTLQGAGTNSVLLGNATNGTGFAAQASDATTVNFLKAFGHATGSNPSLAATGSDTDIGLTLLPKGAGVVQYGTAACFTANGAQTVTVGNLGPGGAGLNITKWLTIKDSGGTVRYIPCFS